MLAEGFLRVLCYREERKLLSDSKGFKTQTPTHRQDLTCVLSTATDLKTDLPHPSDSNPEGLDPTSSNGRLIPHSAVGLSVPGSSPVLTLDHGLTVCLDNCSLLDHYPDLHVADAGLIPLRSTITQCGLCAQPSASEVYHQPERAARQQSQGGSALSVPDQGYLVMGASVNINLSLPDTGLEPMSNSLLNGILEKQLEEVYLQHLTDNLARCSSQLGNSLLHGLVPPPQPSSQLKEPDSPEASLEEESGGQSGKKISYLSTHHVIPYSSHFSSPVLRISEADNAHL